MPFQIPAFNVQKRSASGPSRQAAMQISGVRQPTCQGHYEITHFSFQIQKREAKCGAKRPALRAHFRFQIPFGWPHKPRAHLERPDFSLHFSRTETQSSSLLRFQKPKYKTPPALPKTAQDFGFQISKAPPPRTGISSEIPHFRLHGATEHTRDCSHEKTGVSDAKSRKTNPKSHEGCV